MGGFNKISFGTSDFAANKPQKTMARRKIKVNKRVLTITGLVLLVLILFVIFGIVLPVNAAITHVKATLAQGRIAAADIKTQNIALASDDLKKTQDDLAVTQQDINNMWYLKFIPLVSTYYNDAYHLANAGNYGLNAGQIAIDAIKPYADLLGLKGGHSFVGGSAQDRIQLAVLTMGKITPRIDDIEKQLTLTKSEIDAVDPNHYPAVFGGQKIRDQLTQLKTLTDESATFVEQAKPLIKVLPATLGEPDPQKYLILFQNDKERRPTGGFLTAYAIFSVNQGTIHVDTSNDIYTLDGTISNKPAAPRPILEYFPSVPQLNLRDTNLSPDFVESMKTFNQLYQQAGAYQKVDGIIAVDTHALVAAMNILGDITTDGQTFTTKTDPACNCPEVIYSLELTADRPRNYVATNRKSVIGDLMYAIMQKAFGSSPRLYWGPLFQAMITEASQKHLLFDLYNSDAQAGLESLNVAGRIAQNVQGDYLHVNEANFGGQKSNMFITETMDQKYDLQSDGSIVKTVTMHYKNPYPPSDCSLASGGLCLNAPLRNWIRVYVPQGSQLQDSKGSEVRIKTYDELGKTVFEGFFVVQPLSTATFTVSYRLPFKLASDSFLPLLIQKQPGVDSIDSTIEVGDRQLDQFSLVSDKIEKLNLR